jgi:hypothetical protein
MGMILTKGNVFGPPNMHSSMILKYTHLSADVDEAIDAVMFLAQPSKPHSPVYRDGNEAAKLILEKLYETKRKELDRYLSTNFELDAASLSKELVLNVFGL